MNDLIDRQALIDALDKHCDVVCQYSKAQRNVMCGACSLGTALDVVEALPSAQPDVPDTNVVRNEYTVSATAVEEMLKDLLPARGMWEIEGDEAKNAICETVHDALEGLWKLPFAQPEPCEDAVSRQRLLSDLKELTAAWKKYPVMAEQIKGVETAIGYVETIPSAQPEIIHCKDCKFSHMTINGECKYCDIWFPDEKCYMSGDYYCGCAKQRS